MEELVVAGGRRLCGTVEISGSKNAVLPEIAAALMSQDGPVILKNVPQVSDVDNLLGAVRKLGCRVERSGHEVRIDPSSLNRTALAADECANMRASYYLVGSLLTAKGQAQVPVPGGCCLGGRPVDQHIKGFRTLGYDCWIEKGQINARPFTGDRGKAGVVVLDIASVGATINVLLSAVCLPGTTRIVNAAKEPHVIDLVRMLLAMGADIRGAGSSELVVNGVEQLHGCHWSVIPDQIEAATYMAAAAATAGDVTLKKVCTDDLAAVIEKLQAAGCAIECKKGELRIQAPALLQPVDLATAFYPGFPTDAQPQMAAAMLKTIPGCASVIEETIFSDRFAYTRELTKMGASLFTAGPVLVVRGGARLDGSVVYASDLRAGAALVIAGLAAGGQTVVRNIHFIRRGYEGLCEKLQALGADITLRQSAV